MRVDTVQQAASAQANAFGERLAGDAAQESAHAAAAPSRALVVTAPPAAAPTAPVHRQAAFLAHLIATKAQAPQTRERRRADPSEAIAAYRSAIALMRN